MRAASPKKDYNLQRNPRHLTQTSVVESTKGAKASKQEEAPLTFGKTRPSTTMNLERVSNEEKLNLCRKYYLGGFAFLPFLWLVNIFWFFREAFLVPAYTEQSQIKGYVWRSAVGFLFWVIVLTTWITIFQIYRPRWGALGDYLSFTIPLGTP
ncbi:PREDICTED: gamma-secretase subunit PEN-2 isoform X1 [Galeopterus variegatus]|uniref:Gamma-secretase subunit PEN-2 n=1 Tax=Galeopterus variegatus TaxID=482537 RepID=A0ABM0QZW2_GALVR|nr:PREDICTED: gamma-secretase subunit PEN-2 isoform X1 [Galeopterus variegatus]